MNRILVCLDGSPRAPKVLGTAIHLAERLGARLTLFRAVGLPTMLEGTDAIVPSDKSLMTQLLDDARHELTVMSHDVPLHHLAGIDVFVGTPWDAICNTAKEREVDLVVIGSHGYGGIDRLLGTTAAKVVDHATTCVMVVR